ncbi:MAG: hypothetical protein LUC22_00645, partial [Prevotella sp.]|nr:hypothetical protein [Prevotella sp.]
ESTSSLDAECSRSSTIVKIRANESTSSLDAECSRSSTIVKAPYIKVVSGCGFGASGRTVSVFLRMKFSVARSAREL